MEDRKETTSINEIEEEKLLQTGNIYQCTKKEAYWRLLGFGVPTATMVAEKGNEYNELIDFLGLREFYE